PQLETKYVAPSTTIEKQLASIWADVLGIENIGIHDNFFALGGHSLMATRVNARITCVMQIDLPLRKLFEFPTIAELAAEIENRRSIGQITSGTALTRVDRDQTNRLPLSFAQQRLWFLEQLEGQLTAYNMPYAWRLQGPLDVEALRRALEEVMRRHEPLRTTFAIIDEEPVQIIRPSERFDLQIEDLSGFESQQQNDHVARRCGEEALRPFDLKGDRMLRGSLLLLSENEHILLLTMHHIASDGWSVELLFRKLSKLYEAFKAAKPSPLAALPVQYVDYVFLQRTELEGQRLQQLLQYWRGQLAGISVLELPTDRPRPTMTTHLGGQHSFELPKSLVTRLKTLSQTAGVTLHMTLLAAFKTLLSRYSGQTDIAIGVPVAGRNRSELENLIGFFVNTLVNRTDMSGEPTFLEVLSRVRESSLSAYDHQDLPFERLVEELRPERLLGRSPLVQVLFQLLNFSEGGLALRDLEVSLLPSPRQRVRFDLELHLWQKPKNLCGTLVYSKDLFDPSTIDRMSRHFVTLLEGIVSVPDQRIRELPLLTAAERHQLLVE
ncbi:MAG: condensation domain-containing protein, partial [Planctomycetota bacterium]|nr:condensation domain-containing protein [Planctomycetota bacterium]